MRSSQLIGFARILRQYRPAERVFSRSWNDCVGPGGYQVQHRHERERYQRQYRDASGASDQVLEGEADSVKERHQRVRDARP